MTKQARKIITSIAIAFPLILSACGGSDTSSDKSSSEESSAELTASDIDVSVSCGPWRGTVSGNGETDCNISVTNTSAASGYVYVSWNWKDGDKSCGMGYSTGSDGQPGYISVDANESGTASAVGVTMLCSPSVYNPVPVDVRVRVEN